MRNKKFTNNNPGLYYIVILLLKNLTSLWLTELNKVLRVFLNGYTAVILKHISCTPVVKVTLTVDKQVRIPVYIHPIEPLHN